MTQIASISITDSLVIPLDSSVVLAKAQAGARLRVGLRIRGTSPDRLRIAGSVYTPRLTFRVSPDTLVATDTAFVQSKTPANDATIASLGTERVGGYGICSSTSTNISGRSTNPGLSASRRTFMDCVDG